MAVGGGAIASCPPCVAGGIRATPAGLLAIGIGPGHYSSNDRADARV
jgi:hypothetical protein